MDVKVFSSILLLFATLEHHKTTATIPGITLSITDGENQGEKVATCTLKMDDAASSVSTMHGDTLAGPPGLNLLPGQKGSKGKRGYQGESNIGPRGYAGEKGEKGAMGICSCEENQANYINLGTTTEVNAQDFGTMESPAKVTCKEAPPGVISGNYFMGPPLQSFEVLCNMKTKETCLKIPDRFPSQFIELRNEDFWLSDSGIDLTKISYNLTTLQISWLQKKSAYVRQTLIYRCDNHEPFNVSSVLQLLTWNEILIGPKPTKESPFFYSVPSARDGCLVTSFNATYIELKSSKVNRLPITDARISSNIKNENFYLETRELCFG